MEEKFSDLIIGFIGFTREQTIKNFKSFIDENKEVVEYFDDKNHLCVLKDGTTIMCIFKAKIYKEPLFDQVILSDNSKMNIKLCLGEYDFCFSDFIPEGYRYIFDNTDM